MRSLTALVLVTASSWAAEPLRFTTTGYTTYGEWQATVDVSHAAWNPGDNVRISGELVLTKDHLLAFEKSGNAPASITVLATAERTFDSSGLMRFGSDERFSTLLTPAGLPIEGGVSGAVTRRYGYLFGTPYDQLATIPIANWRSAVDVLRVPFALAQALPENTPPGKYRLRIDFGFRTDKNRLLSLDCQTFASRPSFTGRAVESHVMSPLIPVSGRHVTGRWVEGESVQPRIPWILLYNYNSNGYRGVVADEDRSWFNLSQRNLIHDDVILPLFDGNGRPLAYNLEPMVFTDTIEARNNIQWRGDAGQITVEVTAPDGTTQNLGTFPFVAKSGSWPTTRKSAITAWRPSMYGFYTVRATGWYEDALGNCYGAGGTYRFWIAKRMTLATATFQGMSYPTGNRYGRDIGFAPAFPADVEVTATLYPYSDPARARTITYSGKATQAGVFGAAQGMQPLNFDAPGEYHAQVLARHVDGFGHLWVCSMRHAGVVYPPDSPIIARGKKLYTGGKYLERGDTHFEGWVDPDGTNHLDHINFPYHQRDVLLIAAEGQGANKIEPVLLWEWKDNPQPYDTTVQGIGRTNLKIQTSNGYSPHLFPEYITDWAYFYAAGPRPGFMSRFLVAEYGSRAPYWPTTNTNFGGQINASNNGDATGDIYRLIGGVVLRRAGEQPLYAGYVASAFILPGGTKNNRVVEPGAEDLPGPHGARARFFLVGTRPGMAYETGAVFTPVAQIDPVLPVNVTCTLTYPDGRTVTAAGQGDEFGSFAARDRWTLDQPGVYRYTIRGEWNGFQGFMPGLPKEGGELFVLERERPAGVPRLKLDLLEESTMDPVIGLRITGRSTATEVYVSAIIPGAVLDQQHLQVEDGKFSYTLNPQTLSQKTQTYDIVRRTTGNPEIFDVIHLTFFSKERSAAGEAHDFARVIIRGTKVYCVK
jgi:hypothetical protein